MDVMSYIMKDFEELKALFMCDNCKNLPKQPMILDSCQHRICSDCLKREAQSCPVCKISYCEEDIEVDHFGTRVLAIIEGSFNEECVENVPPEVGPNDLGKFNAATVETSMKRNLRGETPLHLACKTGNMEKVKELLQKNVDINMTDYGKWTALHEAVQHGNYDCCLLLLQKGALPDVPGQFYMTPLYKAVILDNARIAELLLKYGANKDLIDYFGKTAPDLSVSSEMTNVLKNTNIVSNSKPIVYIDSSPFIFYKEVSNECREKLTKLKAKFITDQNFIKRDEVTHLVLEKTDTLDMAILIAIVKGVFVVQKQWIDDYERTEEVVAFNFVPETYRNTVTKSVCNRWMQQPKLFSGMSFHVVDHEKSQEICGVNLNKQDLITLIEQGGGSYVIREPALRTVEGICYFPYHVDKKSELIMCCNYIIYDSSKPPELLYNMKELRHKSSQWLINCILKFNVTD